MFNRPRITVSYWMHLGIRNIEYPTEQKFAWLSAIIEFDFMGSLVVYIESTNDYMFLKENNDYTMIEKSVTS